MFPIKVGIQLASLKMPFKKALHTAASLGARGVEIDARGEVTPQVLTQTSVRQIRKELDDLNLTVCAVGFRTRRGYNVMDDINARVDATKQAMRMASMLGAPVVINHIGRLPKSKDDAEWALLLEVIADLGRFGQHVGALLAAETGTESGAEMAAFIEALPAGSMAVNLDPGNLVAQAFSPSDAVKSLGPHILHVHAKDGVRDVSLGRGVEVELGRGSVDFPQLLGALEEFEYSGFFTVKRDNANEPVKELGRAVEYLNSLG